MHLVIAGRETGDLDAELQRIVGRQHGDAIKNDFPALDVDFGLAADHGIRFDGFREIR